MKEKKARVEDVLNAGAEGATVVQRCKGKSDAIGYDASAAGLLTTEVLIAELPEKSYAPHMNGHMGDMDF